LGFAIFDPDSAGSIRTAPVKTISLDIYIQHLPKSKW
jgi:hypothetical protein